MARCRGRKGDTILDDVFGLVWILPWWGGPLVGGFAYAFLRWGFPWWLRRSTEDNLIQLPSEVFGNAAVMLAPWVALVILAVGVAGQVNRWWDRKLLDTQSGAESVRNLDWREFERLLSEAFRRQGFMVEHCGGGSADGGVDLELERGGRRSLVQCKHWKKDRVGVKVVRELNGVVAAEGAHAGIVVTSGYFTPDAIDFARSAGIALIDGSGLDSMIRSVRTSQRYVEPARPAEDVLPAAPHTPACPKCGATMLLRTATRGQHAGSRFWGCPNYPRCHGTVNVAQSTSAGNETR